MRDARAIEFKRDHAISLGRIVLNSWVVFNELCTAKYVVGAAKNYGWCNLRGRLKATLQRCNSGELQIGRAHAVNAKH